jgi:hypothetical protein
VKRIGPLLGLTLSALSVQGCAAAMIPVAAAGVIGKRQVEGGRKRVAAAEAEAATAALPDRATAATPELQMAEPDAETLTAFDRLDQSRLSNAYLPFARYAAGAARKRQRGEPVSAAVLVDRVSLVNPATVPCEDKPMMAIIDLDLAPDTPAEMDIERQEGFASILQALRESGMRIAWLAEADEPQLRPYLDLLQHGEVPVMSPDDLQLFGHGAGYRKQERRWQLARDHCVIAIAGDRKSDFDELYDYLRDPSYAIRLEAFTNRGWFLLPHPVTAVDSELLTQSSEQKVE